MCRTIDPRGRIMKPVTRHLSRCFVAGIVALLPVGGTVLGIAYMEYTLADFWLKEQDFYFPGLGIAVAAILIYLIGLLVTTFIGKWLWKTTDRVIDELPLMGTLYKTLKQLLGYGEGDDAIFREVVLLQTPEADGEELGLVTNRVKDSDGGEQLIVFIPGAPNPTTGRLIVTPVNNVRKVDMKVNEVMQSLVSVGAQAIPLDRVAPKNKPIEGL